MGGHRLPWPLRAAYLRHEHLPWLLSGAGEYAAHLRFSGAGGRGEADRGHGCGAGDPENDQRNPSGRGRRDSGRHGKLPCFGDLSVRPLPEELRASAPDGGRASFLPGDRPGAAGHRHSHHLRLRRLAADDHAGNQDLHGTAAESGLHPVLCRHHAGRLRYVPDHFQHALRLHHPHYHQHHSRHHFPPDPLRR